MFSLIITLVSIALVIALACAVLYYGSNSREATIKATAATLINQASQINAAGAMATTQGGSWPAYVTGPAFGQPFVNSMPVPPKNAYVDGSALPAATDWTYFLNDGSSHHFVLKNKIAAAVCMAVNKSQGLIGIPAAWDGASPTQCFGPGVANGAGALAYTFFFQAFDATSAQNTAAVNQAIAEAGAGASAGYPRLCPDATTITSGLCPDTAVVTPSTPSTPATPSTPEPPEVAAPVGFGVTVTPGEWNLGTVGIGKTAVKTFTLRNDGTENIWVYTWVDSNSNFKHPRGCDDELLAGATCTLTMQFDAGTTPGEIVDVLNIEVDAPRDYTIKQYPLTATAEERTVSATVNPMSVNFGTVAIGDVGAGAVTVTNSGSAPLTVARVINGMNTYALGAEPVNPAKGEAHNCVNVAPGASCTITPHFVPFEAGAASSTMDIYFEGKAEATSLAMSGTGRDNGALLAMRYLGADIGALAYSDYPYYDAYWAGPNNSDSRTWIAVNTNPKTLTFEIRNLGTKPLTYLPDSGSEGFLSGTGTDAHGWTRNSTTCSNVLAAGQSCSITVTNNDLAMDYGTSFGMNYTAVPGTTMLTSRVFTLCGTGYTFTNGSCTATPTGSTVTFFGNWSAFIGQSELLLTNNVPASCTSAVGISAQNLCMKDFFQAQLGTGASCTLSYGDVAAEVYARHPSAIKEEFLQCSGGTASAVPNVGSYFAEGYRMN